LLAPPQKRISHQFPRQFPLEGGQTRTPRTSASVWKMGKQRRILSVHVWPPSVVAGHTNIGLRPHTTKDIIAHFMQQESVSMRRARSITGVAAILVLATLSAVRAGPPESDGVARKGGEPLPPGLAALREQRTAAAHRKRRIIFNNDGDDACYYNKKGTPEALLEIRTTPLAGSQVDTIFYSTSSCFPCFLHNTKVGEIFTCRENRFENNCVPALIAAGTDPLRVMVDWRRKHGIEVFWSLRMNDTHDASSAWYGPLLFTQFKRDHPDCIMGSREKHPKHGAWSAADYTRAEVRDLCFRIIEEVCQNYDIDGVELDFFRHASFFRRVAWGEEAGADELTMMTGLVRRVRQMTEVEGMKRGRPILVAARAPDSLEYCKGIGLDVERWLSEGLLDMLVTTGYFRLNPWTYSVELGHKYGVPVYPCLSDSRVKGETKEFRRRSLRSYRARAAQAWQAGADGIYLFNLFNPRLPHWRELGDPASLRGLDKLYFATYRDGSASRYLPDGNGLYRIPVIVPRNPRIVTSGTPEEVEIVMAEGTGKAGAEHAAADVTCHLRLQKPDNADRLSIALNGTSLDRRALSGEWVSLPVAPDLVREGVNRVRMTVAAQPEAGRKRASQRDDWDVHWQGKDLAKYPARLPWRSLLECADCKEEARDGCLFLADRSTGAEEMANLVYPWRIAPDAETVVEARVKVLQSSDPLGVCIRVANGASVETVLLGEKSIGLQHANLTQALDATSQFRTYRVVIKARDIRVYVDGELTLDGSGTFSASAREKSRWLPLLYGLSGWNQCSLVIGSATGPGTGAALWESVRFRSETKSVSVTDLLLSVTYPKAIRP